MRENSRNLIKTTSERIIDKTNMQTQSHCHNFNKRNIDLEKRVVEIRQGERLPPGEDVDGR